MDSPPSLISGARGLLRRHHNVALFFGGFLFDILTIQRIDAALDLALQFFYLAVLTLVLVLQYRQANGFWRPGPRTERFWQFNVEVLHFFYGGLLSAYTVLYFKSSSGSRPVIFFLLIFILLLINEMPQVRRIGHRLRLGLYAFCVASYMIYLVPILIGRMGAWVFLISLALSAGLVWGVAGILVRGAENAKRARQRIFWPAGAVLGLISAFYFLRLIPPVPLSVQFEGIYHGVEKTAAGYELKTPRPPWYRFWKKQSRPFRARPGDVIHYFVRLYAPARFQHRVRLRWEMRGPRGFRTTDVMPLAVTGGRAAGFRGYAAKAHYEPGRWRVVAETEDGRAIGILPFTVESDAETDERNWLSLPDPA